MTTLTFRSPVTRPLHRAEWTRPAGSLDFRVTQKFDAIDYYWRDRDIAAGRTPRTHMATDIGNTRCGDAVVAMAAGTVKLVQDNATALGAPSNALGVVIDHGSGITTEYWHLNAWMVAHGATVAAGRQIGIVGSTGLNSVCHCHVEAKRFGVKFDPEPLMFGGSVTLEDDDVKIPAGLKHVTQGVVGVGNRLRRDPDTATGSKVMDSVQFVQVYGLGATGEAWNLGGKAGNTYAWVGWGGETWFVAEPLVTNLQLTATGKAVIPTPDCTALIVEAVKPYQQRITAGKEAAVQIGAVAKALETVLG